MMRTSISPTIIDAGYRINVIPSEAKAQLDVRMLPDENPEQFLAELTRVINDKAVVAALHQRSWRDSSDQHAVAARLGGLPHDSDGRRAETTTR